MRNFLFTVLLSVVVLSAKGQDLNNYKYVIIPETFEFTGETDQYQLNSLTKFLFEQEGFTTLMKGEEKPEDLSANSCLALNTKLREDSGLFVTKLYLELEDCYGNKVFESKEGRRRQKDYKKAFQEALRNAFSEIEKMDYKYEPVSTDAMKKPADELVVQTQKEPEEESQPVAEVQKDIDSSNVQKNEKSNIEKNEKVTYKYSGKSYELRENTQGLGLYQEGAAEPIALLIETDREKSYIYNSLTNQGVAYFDAENNFIVEYFDRQENKKVKIRYELNAQ